MNLYLEEESVSILVRPEITYLAKLISDNFWSIDTIPDMEFGMTQYASSACIRIYTNVKDTKLKTK